MDMDMVTVEVTPVRKPISRNIESYTPVCHPKGRRRVLPKVDIMMPSKLDDMTVDSADSSDVAAPEDCSMDSPSKEEGYISLLDALGVEEGVIRATPPSLAEDVPILVTRAETDILEFEFDDQVYRVHDTASFGTVINTSSCQKRRSLAESRRARKLARQRDALDATSAAMDGEAGCYDKHNAGIADRDRDRAEVASAFWEAAGPSLASELGLS
eukprot:TRINITY_DN41174_c0_g1_i1.p1 TRINITY_DN41174_c0_g1~~TRINITY_DN41174_c0_g1_i1.p1  ORF type:complete len:214 (+),score=32.97 TRINITY_DN41174_c0_g1_i1:55-696(+)